MDKRNKLWRRQQMARVFKAFFMQLMELLLSVRMEV